MAKRFTETGKWKDRWFVSLAPCHKLAWGFVCDECDHAGVIEIVEPIANLQIGCEIDWDEFAGVCGDRIVKLDDGKFWVRAFCHFQYGELNPENRVHKSVLNRLEKLGVEKKGLTSALEGSAEGAKDKDKDKDSKNNKTSKPKIDDLKANEIIASECPSNELAEIVDNWVGYKIERRQGYKPRGLRAVCVSMREFADQHGLESLRVMVKRAMSNGWAGWDFGGRPESRDGPKTFAKQRVENSAQAIKDFANG